MKSSVFWGKEAIEQLKNNIPTIDGKPTAPLLLAYTSKIEETNALLTDFCVSGKVEEQKIIGANVTASILANPRNTSRPLGIEIIKEKLRSLEVRIVDVNILVSERDASAKEEIERIIRGGEYKEGVTGVALKSGHVSSLCEFYKKIGSIYEKHMPEVNPKNFTEKKDIKVNETFSIETPLTTQEYSDFVDFMKIARDGMGLFPKGGDITQNIMDFTRKESCVTIEFKDLDINKLKTDYSLLHTINTKLIQQQRDNNKDYKEPLQEHFKYPEGVSDKYKAVLERTNRGIKDLFQKISNEREEQGVGKYSPSLSQSYELKKEIDNETIKVSLGSLNKEQANKIVSAMDGACQSIMQELPHFKENTDSYLSAQLLEEGGKSFVQLSLRDVPLEIIKPNDMFVKKSSLCLLEKLEVSDSPPSPRNNTEASKPISIPQRQYKWADDFTGSDPRPKMTLPVKASQPVSDKAIYMPDSKEWADKFSQEKVSQKSSSGRAFEGR